MNGISRTIVGACIVLIAGCSGWKFYEIESSYVLGPTRSDNSPRVSESEKSREAISSAQTIAVSAPEACASGPSYRTPEASISGDTTARLLSSCGREMSHVERALVDEGYRVVSSKAIKDRVHDSASSSAEVAGDLGADLLLVINSLEMTTDTDDVTDWDRKYFSSDKFGARGKPIADGRRRRVREAGEIVDNYERTHWMRGSFYSVNLSATAMSTKTGEAIWFYDWKVPLAGGETPSGRYSTKWACDRTGDCKPWGTVAERQRMKRSRDPSAVYRDDSRTSRDRKKYDSLLDAIVRDMARRLRSY